MSSTDSDSSPVAPKTGTKRKAAAPKAPRAVSASEIARNTQHFETWSNGQGLAQVSFGDLPNVLKTHVDSILCVEGKIPLSWTNKRSAAYARLSLVAEPEFLDFVKAAYRASPMLFRRDTEDDLRLLPALYRELSVVFTAWERLQRMRAYKDQKYSESDYASNVYDILRSPAIKQASYRTSRALVLPQPIRSRLSQASARVLKTRMIMPDCAVFAPPSLHSRTQAAYQKLSASKTVKNMAGTSTRRSSFRYQATPADAPPQTPGFEFASSVWEDKKPAHQGKTDAYWQNRMSAASVLRHHHSLRVQAPVIGLVFADATVRAHVDWWVQDEETRETRILSAPYPGVRKVDDEGRMTPNDNELYDRFQEWELHSAADILQVYFLIRNIDDWTVGPFQTLVQDGVEALALSLQDKTTFRYTPWRRVDNTWFTSLFSKENLSHSSASSRRRSSGLHIPIPLMPKKKSTRSKK
ncbi:hypothetical protein BD626DRAFT_566600 [Schizophyllum amplum]|uniref:Uncharacterized protein n=1 Tax=Schizophyllum amplum TaxID=97359 RepID=A0A550CMD0_9AGAR|nr:hypothetical protein BD626DRAFT_566600 [Auriculariopsis ampla]